MPAPQGSHSNSPLKVLQGLEFLALPMVVNLVVGAAPLAVDFERALLDWARAVVLVPVGAQEWVVQQGVAEGSIFEVRPDGEPALGILEVLALGFFDQAKALVDQWVVVFGFVARFAFVLALVLVPVLAGAVPALFCFYQ